MTKIAETDPCAELQSALDQLETQGSKPDQQDKPGVSSVEGYKDLLNGDEKPKGLLGLLWADRVRKGTAATSKVKPVKPKPVSKPSRVDPGAAPIMTGRWRDLPPETLLSLYAQSIRELGDPVLFSLHFTRDVHKRMRMAKEAPRDFIAKRMRRHLQGVPFYFVMELTATNIIHVHGALARTCQSEAIIQAQLQKVCGRKMKSLTKTELFFINCKARHTTAPDWSQSFRQCVGDFGWAQYCGKDIKDTVRRLHVTGTLISRSKAVNDKAKDIYKACLSDPGL